MRGHIVSSGFTSFRFSSLVWGMHVVWKVIGSNPVKYGSLNTYLTIFFSFLINRVNLFLRIAQKPQEMIFRDAFSGGIR